MIDTRTLRLSAGHEVSAGTVSRAELLGQGLFETLRWNGQRFPLLALHQARLLSGADWLGYDSDQVVTQFLEQLQARVIPELSPKRHAVVRFQWSHTQAARGYASAPERTPLTLWQWSELDHPLVSVVPYCTVAARPIPENPGPGCKHSSRLDQVLAADAAAGEPIVRLDADGFVRESLSSNLLFVRQGHVYLPDLSRHGVNGTLQGWVIAHCRQAGIPMVQGDFPLAQLARAEGLVMTNALGLQRVNALHDTRYTVTFDSANSILDGITESLRQFFA